LAICDAGNIFLLDDGRIGLIDFGQVKRISEDYRKALANVVVALADRQSDDNPDDLKKIGDAAKGLGIELKDGAPPEGSAAASMWLFDGKVKKLPGGFDSAELSPNSPVKVMKSFPRDLVLLGRSSILVKALSNRFGMPWSLAQEWAPHARQVLNDNAELAASSKVKKPGVFKRVKSWGRSKLTGSISYLPASIRTKVARVALYFQRKNEAKLAAKL